MNYLITGYHGQPHVTAENDRGINAAIFGAGRFVLPVGNRLRAEYIGNNIVRVYDGKLIDNGAVAGIPAGDHIDFTIPFTGQSGNRNDLVIFTYQKNSSSLVETGSFVVLRGTETTGTAKDPSVSQQDLLTNTATFDQFPLWRIRVTSSAISSPEPLFTIATGSGGSGLPEGGKAGQFLTLDQEGNAVWGDLPTYKGEVE